MRSQVSVGSGSLVTSGALVGAGSDVCGEGSSLVGSPPVGVGPDVSPVVVVVGADVVVEVGADVVEVDVGADVVDDVVVGDEVVGELDVGAGVDVVG